MHCSLARESSTQGDLMKAKLAVFGIIGALVSTTAAAAEYPDPERFRGAIDAFLAVDAESMPPTNAIVATGSSSMRGWHGRIAADLAPLTIIPRGFGGSNMNEVRYFLGELVLRYKPRAVLLYEGDNDVAVGVEPDQILAQFDAIDAAIAESLPDTRIYILAIKPSIARWHLWAHDARHERTVEGARRQRPSAHLPRHRHAHAERRRRAVGEHIHRRPTAYERRRVRHLARPRCDRCSSRPNRRTSTSRQRHQEPRVARSAHA